MLLNRQRCTILLGQAWWALLWSRWTSQLLIWRLDAALRSPRFWCLKYRWRRWSFLRCAAHRCCKSQVQHSQLEDWWSPLILATCCRRGRRLSGSCSTSGCWNRKNQAQRLSLPLRFRQASRLGIRMPLILLLKWLGNYYQCSENIRCKKIKKVRKEECGDI